MSNHTPIPWRRCPHYIAIDSQDGYIVFQFADKYSDEECGNLVRAPDPDVQFENAEFIVKAFNCHDELLEACKAALQSQESCERNCELPLSEREQNSIALLRAAITRAEASP